MAVGPFVGIKAVYELAFVGFTVKVHLKSLNTFQAAAVGLDVTRQNLEALCCDPLEGDPRILDGMSATVSPSFRGLEGTFTVKGRPESRLLPVVESLGLKLYGTFTELASSVDDGADWTDFSRVRRVQTGIQPDTRAPIFDTPTETVRLKLVRSSGDQTSDTGSTSAVVIALAGKLAVGDVLIGPDTYVVTNTPLRKGDYEQADVSLRDY